MEDLEAQDDERLQSRLTAVAGLLGDDARLEWGDALMPAAKAAFSSKSKSIVEASDEQTMEDPSATSFMTASAYLMTVPTSKPPKAFMATQHQVMRV